MLPSLGSGKDPCPAVNINLLGNYYGEGIPVQAEFRQPEGRARMRGIVGVLLAVAESGGGSASMLEPMRSG